MRRLIGCLALASVLSFAGSVQNATAEWVSFVIRNASDGSSPVINDVTTAGKQAKEFVITKANQKAGWGTSSMDDKTIGDLEAISIERLDNAARFTAGSGPAVGPYINIWITDGNGNFAVVANEPSNPEWQPDNQQWNMTWDILKTKTAKIYETNNKTWLPKSGVSLTFGDLVSYKIKAPTSAQLSASWSGLGTGAPRDSSNKAYGFNWVFGDSLSNYVSGDPGYIVANPVVIPEPGSFALLIAGSLVAMAAAWLRPRFKA